MYLVSVLCEILQVHTSWPVEESASEENTAKVDAPNETAADSFPMEMSPPRPKKILKGDTHKEQKLGSQSEPYLVKGESVVNS